MQRSALPNRHSDGMKYTFKLLILAGALLLLPTLAPTLTWAQNSTRPLSPRADASNVEERPISEIEEEMKAKQAIKFAEKGHQENISRAKEISDIGKELKAAVNNATLLNNDSYKKLERLEKLTRKIRGEAGGDDQEVKLPDRPSDVPTAIKQIAAAADVLSKDVQNTPRQVVSATVINNANVLLELIKVMRTLTRQP
ncbi:MAG TPA: hypothetical protein VJS17_03035 [Pyrinomonadaceae bacterium]|nr:hypothetical protein [Pyrinomonadaceae bacterium]